MLKHKNCQNLGYSNKYLTLQWDFIINFGSRLLENDTWDLWDIWHNGSYHLTKYVVKIWADWIGFWGPTGTRCQVCSIAVLTLFVCICWYTHIPEAFWPITYFHSSLISVMFDAKQLVEVENNKYVRNPCTFGWQLGPIWGTLNSH